MDALVNQTLDRYRIDALLGEGGMGAVFRARDVTLQRDVAIKVMHPQFARRPDFRERFLQEARTAARLDHPGIVKVHDFGQARSYLYIVMEFIPGSNLRTLLQELKARSQWIVLSEAIELIRQVALAIDYAHRQGVLHRDIKPDNIMLKPEPAGNLPYRPILTDLGLAKLADGGIITQEGTSMGTPAYMSPEQAAGTKTDARSDVYSLGVLLYELAVGQLPFPARTITEAIRYHTQEPPPPPRSRRPDLPEALERVILKAMAKNPAERFADARSLAEALAGVLALAPSAPAEPTAAATDIGEAVSLATQYQQSVVQARGRSILAEFPSAPHDLAQDAVQVLTAEGTSRTVPLGPEGLTIGRGAENGLVLDSPRVSRRHARIEFDGTDYRVIDLDSTNGTFLGDVKLLPGVPEVWTPDKALRVGGTGHGAVWLRLLRATPQPVQSGPIRHPDGTMVEPGAIRSSPGVGRVGVFMEREQLSVTPGESVTASLIVLNQSSVVDQFSTTVEGVPESWLIAKPAPVRLMPGQQQEVTFTLRPPRSPQGRAGRYPLTIRVASLDAPDQVAEVRRNLTVAAYSEFSSTLQPQQVWAGKPVRVTVENRGNAQETFTISWQDRADELAFDPPEMQLKVAEGRTAAAEFRAEPKKRRWIGGEKPHAVSAQITSSTGEAQIHSGQVVSRALLPIWLLPVLFFLCAGLAVLAAMIDLDGDKLTYAQELRLGTNPTNADSDGDGLTDKQEADARTNPQVADTDGDGLSDGEELRWGSNPLVVDSDGDTLADGQEVHQLSTSPINADTDGDGLADNMDPMPRAIPTATVMPTVTPTSTPTPDLSGTDADGDGLTLAEEQALGTNPNNPDSDGDGLKDGEERAWGANPLVIDSDGDTLPDGREVHELSTSPTNPDTDGDGMRDNVDPAPGSPPTATWTPVPSRTPTPGPGAKIDDFVGTWVNVDENTTGLITLIIDKVNTTTVSLHGYSVCKPTNCDWGTFNGSFAPYTVKGTQSTPSVKRSLVAQRSGSELHVKVTYDFAPDALQRDYTESYVLKPQLILRPFLTPLVPVLRATLSIKP
ncbi:MAG: protein kinase [Chloroflexi bacterium]|nr:protein kinase [Chloroflexota bacterium]